MTATRALDLSLLPDDEREEYLRLRVARDGGETLREFIARVSPHRPPPRHFAPLIDQLERARLFPGTVNVCISLPPRHGKTTLIQHAIAWWLSRRPADTCAYVSYSNDIAYSKSFETRDLATKAGVPMNSERSNLAEWRTVHGGGLLSTGVGGGLTGKGVSGLMIFDDPYKNMKAARSAKVREDVESTYDAVVQSRIEGASTFIIHTRWDQDDLIGKLSKDPDWVVINIPAIAEADDILGREPGEPLWPERFGLPYLNKRKKRNPVVFQALYQGQPLAVGAKVFKAAHYFDQTKWKADGMSIVIGADPATTDDPTADFSVAIALYIQGRDPETFVAYVVDVYREQVETPMFVDELISFQGRHSHAPAHVEAVAGFKAVPQMMRKIRPKIDLAEVRPIGNKWLRAQPLAGAWNEGRVLVPLEAPWLADLLEEFRKFTGFGDRHDDIVDAMSHAFNNAFGEKTMADVEW